jgi:SAM-dependent methyltransferase
VDAAGWDDRYTGREPVWSRGPNATVAAIAGELPAGRALDLACGEGRNALWLAESGWTVEAVDFSEVAIERGREWADESGISGIRWVVADLLEHPVAPRSADLVLLSYLHLPAAEQQTATRKAAAAVAPGGTLLVIGHDPTNLADGYGGPQEPSVLHGADDYARFLAGSGLAVARAERIDREVETDDGVETAIDVLVVATRP